MVTLFCLTFKIPGSNGITTYLYTLIYASFIFGSFNRSIYLILSKKLEEQINKKINGDLTDDLVNLV